LTENLRVRRRKILYGHRATKKEEYKEKCVHPKILNKP